MYLTYYILGMVLLYLNNLIYSNCFHFGNGKVRRGEVEKYFPTVTQLARPEAEWFCHNKQSPGLGRQSPWFISCSYSPHRAGYLYCHATYQGALAHGTDVLSKTFPGSSRKGHRDNPQGTGSLSFHQEMKNALCSYFISSCETNLLVYWVGSFTLSRRELNAF